MADRDLQVQLATGNEGEAPSNSSSVKDSSDSGNEGIVSDPAADHEGEEGNEEEGEGEEEGEKGEEEEEEEGEEEEEEGGEEEEEEEEREGEGEGEGESDFSDSEDEDLQQLVQTLQSFVQDWSKSLVAAPKDEDWVCIRQCVCIPTPESPPTDSPAHHTHSPNDLETVSPMTHESWIDSSGEGMCV